MGMGDNVNKSFSLGKGCSIWTITKENVAAQKLCVFKHMLVKLKCVWEAVVNCKQTAEKCEQIFENWKYLPPLKRISTLPTKGQKCTVS